MAKVHFPLVKYAINIDLQCSDKASLVTGHVVGTSGVLRNFVRGGVQQIQLRTEITGIWGDGSPLVRDSGDSCNLVQEISFHIVKFS